MLLFFFFLPWRVSASHPACAQVTAAETSPELLEMVLDRISRITAYNGIVSTTTSSGNVLCT